MADDDTSIWLMSRAGEPCTLGVFVDGRFTPIENDAVEIAGAQVEIDWKPGFINTLTEAQRAEALAYTGDDTHGSDEDDQT